MRNSIFAATFAIQAGVAGVAYANPYACPESILYSDGATLRDHDAFYYPNGQLALTDAEHVAYPDGAPLREQGITYYPDGSVVQEGSGDLLYPDGSKLRFWNQSGYDFNYPSGAPLKRGDTFYYPDGRIAARAGGLLGHDGRPVNGPVLLKAPVGDWGSIEATLDLRQASVGVWLNRLSGAAADHLPLPVGIVANWPDRRLVPDLVLVLPISPESGHAVYLTTGASAVQCTMTPQPSQPGLSS